MTNAMPLSLDHVGFMVRDLDAGAARWRRLGFQLSRRSAQMGRVPGKAEMAPWATSNHCAMFERGYLELIGVASPGNYNPWTRFLDRFEGPHITALRCRNADETYAALRRRIDHFDPPLQRLRNAPYGDGERPFRFRNIFSQDAHFPEGRFIVIEHQTPEVIWQPDLMVHPNGAVGLVELVFCATEAEGTLDRLAAITGETPVQSGDGAALSLGGGGVLSVVEPGALRSRYAGAQPPPTPSVAAAVVEVADLDATADLLRREGVVARPGDGGAIWVAANDANGGIVEFRKA